MVYVVVQDRMNPDRLWIATAVGLAEFSRSRNFFVLHASENSDTSCLLRDGDDPDVLWVSPWPAGLGRFEIPRKEYTAFYTFDPDNPDRGVRFCGRSEHSVVEAMIKAKVYMCAKRPGPLRAIFGLSNPFSFAFQRCST